MGEEDADLLPIARQYALINGEEPIMKVQTKLTAGAIQVNHTQMTARTSIPVKSQVKAGGWKVNHNTTLVRAGMSVTTDSKVEGRTR